MTDIHADRVLILDFGAQYTQLIARRVREMGVYCEIYACDVDPEEIIRFAPTAIILSGGPESVYDAKGPEAPPAVFTLGVPVLGICYGMQTMAAQLGGQVELSQHREFGAAQVRPAAGSRKELARPPRRGFLSSTTTRRPACARRTAHDNPENPPPRIKTSARSVAEAITVQARARGKGKLAVAGQARLLVQHAVLPQLDLVEQALVDVRHHFRGQKSRPVPEIDQVARARVVRLRAAVLPFHQLVEAGAVVAQDQAFGRVAARAEGGLV